MTNNIAKIRAALEMAYTERFKPCSVELRIDEALAALAELEKAAAEPVATLVGFDVESGRPVDIAWHTDCAAFNSGDKLYATPPPAKPAPLGPALGLVEIREPTREDYIAISEKYADIRREQVGTLVHASVSAGMMREGRDIFTAVSKWRKGEL